ncbi:hypothetical protein TNCV_1993181 [Trichonephila clavipes]|nr:hypothetical protein TNCV_1993181 [Trichonephila clavipes]
MEGAISYFLDLKEEEQEKKKRRNETNFLGLVTLIMKSLTVLREGSCFPASEKNVRHRKPVSPALIGRWREGPITVNEINSRLVTGRGTTLKNDCHNFIR